MNRKKLLKPFEVGLRGINLVEASAGTGKTYNITSLYIRALIEEEISVGKILVVTYTEAATKELKDRLLGRIRKSISVLKSGVAEDESDQFLKELPDKVDHHGAAVEKLERAVRNFDEASIYTIHGFCYQALQEQAFESGAMYDAEMIGEDIELVQEAVDDYWRNWVAGVSEHPEKRPLLKLLQEKGLGPESLAKELGSYIGKPYLKILPEEVDQDGMDSRLNKFLELHTEMKEIWENWRPEILELLSRDEMSNYRSDWLSGWFAKMDILFQTETPSVEIFDQFDRFTQSRINNSLVKAAVEKGINPPQHKFFELADEYQQVAHSLRGYEIVFKKELLKYLRVELDQKKEELQVLSYDDLLLRLRNALLDSERGSQLAQKLRRKYPLAMVDEFQDTDPNQYDIFRTIYRNSDAALFMIGDPKQSIYSFRGADVYSYIRARRDAPEANRYRLDRNFRSTPKLLQALNAFWGRHDNPFVVGDDIEYQEVKWGLPEETYNAFCEKGEERPPIRFQRLSQPGQDQLTKGEAKEKVVRETADEIQRLLEGGNKGTITIGEEPLRAKDIAVLVRRHSQADLVSDALRERGIKSVQHSDKNVFESDEAQHLQQLLSAVAEPASETRIKTALSLPLTGYTAADLYAIEEDEQKWMELLQQFADWHRRWREQGFSAMYRSLLDELEVSEQVMRYADGERRLTNLLHLGELLQEEARQQREGMRGLLNWLARKRDENSRNKRDEEQLRLESDEELVKIVTMHKSKGLEYPVVFCPFLWHGPDIRDQGQPLEYHRPGDPDTTCLDLSGKSDPERSAKRFWARREAQAESMRLAYVAMTRAEHSLYLAWDFANASEFSSLGYLLQDPGQAEALLKAKVKDGPSVQFSGDEFHQAIETLCNNHPELFTLDWKPETTGSGQLQFPGMDREVPELNVRSFGRATPLTTSYRLSSFSSLTSWMEEDPDMPDYDQFLEDDSGQSEVPEKGEKTIFTFPRGPQPGTCIHNIFENYFSKSGDKDEVIANQLKLHGIDESWNPVVSGMLDMVLTKPLHPGIQRLNLSDVKDNQVPEMEFYFQNEEVETEQLLSIIRDNGRHGFETGGKAGAGFLKGFIDLTFCFDGKYYLLDYKTNHLGNAVEDYRPEILREEMWEASYDLQYHIYTVALHRFLKKKLPGYSYREHFGGAFYLFLRGMNAKGREGIYFDKPDFSIIQQLNQVIGGGKDE